MFEEELRQAKASGQSCCIVVTDIDCFKKLDDKHGHAGGDEILKQLATVLKNNSRRQDIVGRAGGDEFMVLLPGTEKEEALILLEDIRRFIAGREFKIKGTGKKAVGLQVSISAGISAFPRDGKNSTALWRSADNALMLAKRTGRDRVCLAFDEKMVLKSNYYTKGQLERLTRVAKDAELTEAFLLREALDDVIDKYFEKMKKLRDAGEI